MKTIAALLFAVSAALAVIVPLNASAMSMTSGYKASNISSGTTLNAVQDQQTQRGRSCPIDRPYQCQ